MATLGYQLPTRKASDARPDGESEHLIDEVAKFVDQPEAWMQASNAQLGGLSPNQAVDRLGEEPIRMILRQARFNGVA